MIEDPHDLDLGATIRGFMPGQRVFGRYMLQRILGRGGMGVVWLAKDEELEQEIALKFLPEVVMTDRGAMEDLKREARRSRELAHPHIVRIHDFVRDERVAAISMEYVAGDTLANRRVERPQRVFEAETLGPWVEQACAALEYAHGKAKVVHRDLKPANLMVDAAGEVKVADFGIARSITDSVSRVSRAATGDGSLPYMSPQQLMGEPPAVSDDVYALGATLYELLTGKPPFHSGGMAAIMAQVQGKVPPTMTARRKELGVTGAEPVPAAWEETVAACLAKEAGARPRGAKEVWEKLSAEKRKTSENRRTWESGKAGNGEKAEMGNAERGTSNSERRREGAGTKSRTGIWVGAVAVLALGGAGYWFGVAVPDRERKAEVARQETAAKMAAEEKERERVAAEAARVKAEEDARVAAAAAQAESEARAYAAVVAKIEAVVDGAPRSARDQAEQTVREYLPGAPERYRGEVEGKWAQRSVAWETARLAAARGGIAVRSLPAGAEVSVGALERGVSPLTIREAKLGKYPVRVRLEGYDDWDGEVEVTENAFAEVEAKLVRSLGAVKLASVPPGLSFELSGPEKTERGKTPATVGNLPTGEYTLTVRREGWPDERRTVRVRRGESVAAEATFAGGTLELTSEPSGAEVWEDGRAVGKTPLSFADAAPRDYAYEYRMSGYRPAKVAGSIVAGETSRAGAVLEKVNRPEPGQPWENSLGMKFVRVPGASNLLFGVWEVRESDYGAFVRATGRAWSGAKAGETHPAANVSWEDAKAFCAWLTERERSEGILGPEQSYRLPADWEWSLAVGLNEARGGTPVSKDGKIAGEYPWGREWPPPRGAGNYADETAWRKNPAWAYVDRYNDGHAGSAPVASFPANRHGLHDLGGNVAEWCEDYFNGTDGSRVIRGASFAEGVRAHLLSSYRALPPGARMGFIGFRCVVVVLPFVL